MLCGDYLLKDSVYLSTLQQRVSHNACHSVGIQIILFYAAETPAE